MTFVYNISVHCPCYVELLTRVYTPFPVLFISETCQ